MAIPWTASPRATSSWRNERDPGTHGGRRAFPRILACAAFLARKLAPCGVALLAGCNPNVIEGSVADVQGNPLPGVAVQAQSGGAQAITDALGQYRLPFLPGKVTLEFMKTGYTPGRLELTVGQWRRVQANAVALWPLPPSKGVYLFERFRYQAMGAAEPRPYRMGLRDAVHGAAKSPDVTTENPNPCMVCFKMPDYDLAFCKMRLADVSLPGFDSGGATEKVWIRAQPLPVLLEPIDQPDATLVELRLSRPLEPGVYGIHWGALDGYASTDSRVFLFRVAEPGKTLTPEEESATPPAPDEKSPTPVKPRDAAPGEDVPGY